MAKAPKEYRRLTRNAAGLGSYASLWLGADHLVIVRSSGYHENYARLLLSDLKGIFLTVTHRRMWWGIFWGVMAGWSALVLIAALVARGTPVFSVFFLAMGSIGLVWNHLASEGCRAYVLTGVQTAELPSLIRMKQARRVLGELRPAVVAAQAGLVTFATPPPPPPSSSETPAPPMA